MKRTILFWTKILLLIGLFLLPWISGFLPNIYAEAMFDQVRWGPYQTMAEVDEALSWFKRREISIQDIPSDLLRGDAGPLLEGYEVRCISYYIGQFGFIVVYDLNGTKLTQLKSDV